MFIRNRQQMIGELCVLLTLGELALVGAGNIVESDPKVDARMFNPTLQNWLRQVLAGAIGVSV